jgi:hypothetical protein
VFSPLGAEKVEFIAKLEADVFQLHRAGRAMVKRNGRGMVPGIGRERLAVAFLILAVCLWFIIGGVRGKVFGQKNGPDLQVTLPGVVQFILSVGNGLGIALWMSGSESEALPGQLNESLAGVDLAPEHFVHVPVLCAEDFLPHRFVAEGDESVGDELAGAVKLLTDGADEDPGPVAHVEAQV